MTIIISGSSGIQNQPGTAGSPSLTSGSGNTGMYFPNNTQVAFSTLGIQSMLLDSTGNLTLTGSIIANSIISNSTVAVSSFTSTGNVSIGGNVVVSAGTNSLFGGNLGIGTSTFTGVANAFTVYGSANHYGNVVLFNTVGQSGVYFPDGSFLITAGGGGSYSNANVSNYLSGPVVVGNLTVANTTISSNTTTGAAVIKGGLGVAGNINIGGNLALPGTGNISAGNIVLASNITLGGNITFADGSTLGSASTATVVFDYTGTGSQTVFSVAPYTATSVNNTSIFISGAYQRKNQYTWTGTNIVFTSAPPNTSVIEINLQTLNQPINVPAAGSVTPAILSTGGPSWDTFGNVKVISNLVAGGNIVVGNYLVFPDGSTSRSSIGGTALFDYTGDGVTTAFSTGNYVATTTLNTNIYIGSIYQNKSQYSWTGTTITFVTAPPAGAGIEINISSLPSSTVAQGSIYPAALSQGGPTWNSSGNLGIGTTSPTASLNVYGGNVGIGTAAPNTTLQVAGNMNANNFTTDPSGVIQSYNKTISTVYTIPTNQNALSVGNVQLAPGANVTIQPGTRWVIV